MKTKLIASVGVVLASVAQVSQAVSLDLTTAGSSGTVNGGIFEQVVVQPSGTGVIDSFLRIQNQGGSTTESGYNSSVRPVMPDVKTDPNFTRDILLSSVPTVTRGLIDYYQFLLDLDEPNSANQGLITLYELQIFTKSGALSVGDDYDFLQNNATKVWDLDTLLIDSKIELKDLNAGNGQADMYAYIPVSALGTDLTKNVYLYSSFGIPETADGSFEEWAVLKSSDDDGGGGGGGGQVPDGGTTLASLGIALLGLGTMRRFIISKK